MAVKTAREKGKEEMQKHHILFPRTLWNAHPATRELRRNRWLIPELSHDDHVELHRQVITVSPLGRYIAARVLRDFVPIGGYVDSLEALCECIESATRHPRVTDLEIRNAEVTMLGIRLQLPFVRESTVSGALRNQIPLFD